MAKDFLRTFFSVKMLIIFLHGFAQGLPFILIGSTLKTWMAREGIALSTVTYFTWTSIPYSWKFLWSAFLDHYQLTRFGRRRSWMFLTQVLLTLLILTLGTLNPNIALMEFALIATAIGFLSATQDIAIDAYRREYLEEKELGLGSSVVQYGFRVAMLLGG